ncbi:MAG: DUF4138 domain-containing protein [Sediminibacterium sp.]
MRNGIVVLLFFFCFGAKAQQADSVRYIAVSSNKTTSVIFPSTIISIDRGSERIVVQKSIHNILRVKADSVFTDTTSLTVITSDGKLYAFLVHFSVVSSDLTIHLSKGVQIHKDTFLLALSQRVQQAKNLLHGIGNTEGGVRASILGIYATGELIICKLKLENNSSLSYEIGGVRVYSKERVTAKRRSSQERVVEPLLSLSQQTIVREKGVLVFTLIIPKPSLTNARSLRIDIAEKDGERNHSLSIVNRYLVNAILIH